MMPSIHRSRRLLCLLVWFSAGAAMGVSTRAQEARVAASALKIDPVSGQNRIAVSLRFLEKVSVTSATARVKSAEGEKTAPASWMEFEKTTQASCAWMIVVDNSNPARQRTVEACADEVRGFLKLLPERDEVMIASLARDLVVTAPFGSTATQQEKALSEAKADGDASFTSLIFQNVKHALEDHLVRRPEARRCVVLLTDGKDETPGGPLRVTERRNELITEARKLGIPIHTLGFAEKATEANYFADLKELSLQTDGLHIPASVATRHLPPDTWPTLVGAMHNGGVALLDLVAVMDGDELRLVLTCEAGQAATVEIPKTAVAAARPTPPVAAPPMPDRAPEPQQAKDTSQLPVGSGWVAAGVALLLLLITIKARSAAKKPAESKIASEPPANVLCEADTLCAEVIAVPLAYLERMDSGEKHPVTAKGVKIGGAAHNDIVLRHESVSDDHCSLSLKDGEWLIADVNSTHGLRVNGTYYHQTTLSPGNVVELGEVKMRFLGE